MQLSRWSAKHGRLTSITRVSQALRLHRLAWKVEVVSYKVACKHRKLSELSVSIQEKHVLPNLRCRISILILLHFGQLMQNIGIANWLATIFSLL